MFKLLISKARSSSLSGWSRAISDNSRLRACSSLLISPPSLFFLVIFLLTACGTVKPMGPPALPLDPEVETGVLDNGLTWYIRRNEEPEKRAVLRLVIKAGSLLEEEDQQGLAHFLEHMAFNGTKNFEKLELINYLESIGMDFGPDINAYTSFEETVYKLEIPTDDQEILEKAFQVLEDWAHHLTLDDEAIEEERGVIQEEWRLSRGASGRIRDQILPVLFKDSRYAERLPIGKVDVFMEAPPQRVRDFYQDWYHPELMAVIAVGDFDIAEIRGLVEKHFSFSSPRPSPKLPVYQVPPQELPRVKIISDPELTAPSVDFLVQKRPAEKKTEEDFRDFLVQRLFWTIFNQRLKELTRKVPPPFQDAAGEEAVYISPAAYVVFYATLREDDLFGGMDALAEEIYRAQRFGVTKGELMRAKKDLELFSNNEFKERNNIPSRYFAEELVDYFLKGNAMPGVEEKHRLAQALLPDITLEDVTLYARSIFPDDNRILLLTLPETTPVPKEEALLTLLRDVKSRNIAPPRDDKIGELPRVSLDEGGKVVDRGQIEAWGAEEWVLSNGARVVIKPTNFMEDQILFYGFSPGGLSLEEDSLFHDGLYAPTLVQESGFGDLSAGDLRKATAGLDVNFSFFLEGDIEGLSGSASTEDFESLLSLIRLAFTAPRFDERIFENLMVRLDGEMKNRLADPFTVYTDRFREIVSSGSYRARPLDQEILATLDFEEMKEVFTRRFAGAGDFTYIFVGNIDPEKVGPMVAAYLGSLPPGAKEEWKDRGIRPPSTVVDEQMKKGLSPQGYVALHYTGEGEFTAEEEEIFGVLGDILEGRLRETLREAMGGTYSVGVSTDLQSYPLPGWSGTIQFGCDPDRTEELSARVFEEIKNLQKGILELSELQREKEQYRRHYEVAIKENESWLMEMAHTLRRGKAPAPPLPPETFGEYLTSQRIVKLANRVFNGDRWIRLVLLPEEQE